MATQFILRPKPHEVELPTEYLAQPQTVQQAAGVLRPVLAFDGAVNENALWSRVAPSNWNPSTLDAYVYFMMPCATAGDVDWRMRVEATSIGDAVSLLGAYDFDAANWSRDNAVPGMHGQMARAKITLANHDGSAVGDYLRFWLTRDAENDTAPGDAYVLFVAIVDAA